MPLKIAHISDIHIRKLRYHQDYRIVFQQLYDVLRKEKPDLIINTGDTFHTKLDLSPEAVRLISELFENLADIAPYHIILGNHDANLKNSARLDVITPIIENINHSNIHFHKYSDTVKINNDINLHILSVLDEENWIKRPPKDKVNIALFHGSVIGAKTDTGWSMSYGDIDFKILKKFDYAMLGDIHKTYQKVDSKGRYAWPGSLIQQNHGETNNKGFLIWEIENKDSFNCRHIELKNPKPFITVELTPKGRLPNNIELPENARLRLVSNNNLPLDVMKRSVSAAKHRFSPESVIFLNRAVGGRGNVDELSEGLIEDDLRNISVQEELISEYLKDYQIDSRTLEKIYILNKSYNSIIEENEEVLRNIRWKLNTLEWDNLFNYGEGNKIDFARLNGIVGILGKNFSGKSSIIDSILYTMFNSSSKGERKNLNIINQNKDMGYGKLKISIGNEQFVIERKSEKYVKKLKGGETLEAKTDLNFYCKNVVLNKIKNLNGTTRNDTDKNIRKYFGSLEDFLLTSMSSQMGALAFISEGSTRRKEILAKFLDLEIFDKKYKSAKDEATDIKVAIKRLENREFNEEIKQIESDIAINKDNTQCQKDQCDSLIKKVKDLEKEQESINKKISSIPTNVVNIKNIKEAKNNIEIQYNDLKEKNVNLSAEITDGALFLKKIEDFFNSFNIEEIKEKKEKILIHQQGLDRVELEIKENVSKKENQTTKTILLKEVPCGTRFPQCKFINNAHVAAKNLLVTDKTLLSLKSQQEDTSQRLKKLNPTKTDEYINKYNQLVDKQIDLRSRSNELRLHLAKNKNQILSLENIIDEFKQKEQEYLNNKEAIENKEELLNKLQTAEDDLERAKTQLENCENEITGLYKQHGSLEQKLLNVNEQKQELHDLQEKYSVYDLFMKCMHSGGISYDIIKQKLPIINQEIAKILVNVVAFEVFFEDDGKHLKMFIKHLRHDARPLSMGSGAEKTIAAMAIRLALLSVSNLPRPDIFILDEPGTALDENNMEGFVRILDMVKSYFKTVLLISHLDSLKDCVDTQIVIDKEGDYAHVKI